MDLLQEDAKKAKQDEAGAVIPDAIVNRRQKKKVGTGAINGYWWWLMVNSG